MISPIIKHALEIVKNDVTSKLRTGKKNKKNRKKIEKRKKERKKILERR